MTKPAVLASIGLLLLSAFVPLNAQGLIFNRDIVVESDEVQENLITFNGSILVKGEVREHVIAFGGKIVIDGLVGESVIGFGTEITLNPTAHVRGDVVSFGGTLTKKPGARLDGDTVSFNFESAAGLRQFLREGLFGTFVPLLIILRLITLFVWFVLALVLAAVAPRQISYASNQVRSAFWPIFGVGLLSIMIFIGLLVFSVFLSFFLIGIPILIILILLALVINLFGRVVVFHLLGEGVAKAFGNKNPSPPLAVTIGVLLVGFIGFIPLLGSLFTFVLSIIGWGVIIRTKFGTTENWFKRQV